MCGLHSGVSTLNYPDHMDKTTKGNNGNNNGTGRSQRRLALAVLLILLIAGMFFIMSDSPLISGLRDRLISGTEVTDPDGAEEPDETEQTGEPAADTGTTEDAGNSVSLETGVLPEYNGNYYVSVNGNIPAFPYEAFSKAGLVSSIDEADGGQDVSAAGGWSTDGSKAGRIQQESLVPYEYYGELDNLGRCTVAYGCLGEETMPGEGTKRGDISGIHPSGWARAQNWERCHLIAWALGAENANERNLVTGTHYMNYDGMRPLEEEVEHYIWNTGNHVLYMSRPMFQGNELVPRGVQMSAWSCEDQGKGISFNVYCFNVTPGAEINYMNGVVTTEEQAGQEARLYVINTRSGVFHYPSCEGAQSIHKNNRKEVTTTRKELTDQGYMPCGACEP